MSDELKLEEAIESIKTQADRKETAKNIDEKVATARGTASSLNDDVAELAEAVRQLQFYQEILTEMFDENIPRNVHSALEEAEAAVEPDQSDIVDRLVEDSTNTERRPINELRKDVTGAKSSVDSAKEDLKDLLRYHRNKWDERLSSARELQQIIGEQNDDFTRTVSWLENIIGSNMWMPNNSAYAVVNEWEKATNQWENHQDLQGLDAFQRTHGLSDDAINAIERLSSRSNLTLADVDIDALKELKKIDQLSKAVNLNI